MNADPLAQLLASRDRDLINVTPDVHMMLLAEEVAWMRAHRDELLRALYPNIEDALTDLGSTKMAAAYSIIEDLPHGFGRVTHVKPGESVWVFGEDA